MADKRKREAEGYRKGPMDSQFYGMIKEDHNAMANLPQDVKMEYYPKVSYLDAYELDDTMRGLDDTRSDDVLNMERHASKDKY